MLIKRQIKNRFRVKPWRVWWSNNWKYILLCEMNGTQIRADMEAHLTRISMKECSKAFVENTIDRLEVSALTFKQYWAASFLHLSSRGMSFASTCKLETGDVWNAQGIGKERYSVFDPTFEDMTCEQSRTQPNDGNDWQTHSAFWHPLRSRLITYKLTHWHCLLWFHQFLNFLCIYVIHPCPSCTPASFCISKCLFFCLLTSISLTVWPSACLLCGADFLWNGAKMRWKKSTQNF